MPSILDYSPANSGKVLLIGRSGCLSGDTIVVCHKKTKYRPVTVRRLYNQINNLAWGPGASNWDPEVPVYIMRDEYGITGEGQVMGVTYSGIKKVYELIVGSRRIKATIDHRFKTPEGWKTLGELQPRNSEVYIWDKYQLEGRRKTGARSHRKIIYSVPYHPFAMANVVGGRNYKRINAARLILEADMNGLSIERMIRILRKDPITAAKLMYIPKDQDVHHLDGDSTNDSIYNLVILDSHEHNKQHHQEVTNLARRLCPAEVVSITEVGNEETFDIEMDAPHHNFVANGIVTHNSGKTGSLASLVAGGYKLRILDTDKGARSLRSLLTDTHYPYSKLIEKNQIDLRAAVDIVPIDEPMRPSAKHDSITPVAASAWPKLVSLLDKWKYSDTDLGSLRSWDENTILVLDTLSTVSEGAFNQIQGLNNRLGAIASGFDYQRDIGGAQNLVKSLLQLLYDSSIKCGVIIVTHITFVDESRGLAARPGESGLPEGYPSAIGRALSTQIGKYFNDVFLVRSTGSGQSVKREIWTVPQDGVVLKNSVYLEKSYPISSGMIEIFSALQNKPYPSELVRAIRGEDKNNQNPPTSGAPPHPNPIRPKL